MTQADGTTKETTTAEDAKKDDAAGGGGTSGGGTSGGGTSGGSGNDNGSSAVTASAIFITGFATTGTAVTTTPSAVTATGIAIIGSPKDVEINGNSTGITAEINEDMITFTVSDAFAFEGKYSVTITAIDSNSDAGLDGTFYGETSHKGIIQISGLKDSNYTGDILIEIKKEQS